MAKIRELASLFHAASAGDWARTRMVAQNIADSEEKAGHHGAAAALRGALASTGPRPERAGAHASEAFELTSLGLPHVLTQLPVTAPLVAVELSSVCRRTLQELVKENRNRAVLAAHTLRPRNRLFFYGPPGCGKTLTARALGKELNLPVFLVRFDALVGSYLGQTAMRIHEVFRTAETRPCVLLIDELDAVGRRRGNPADVGELDRIVISLMQQLELTDPAGMIVAASNIPNELDPALLRRFDATIEFRAPTVAQIYRFARKEANNRGIRITTRLRRRLAGTKSYAEAEQLIQTEHRRSVLNGA